jgi:hypothetical protein
MKQIIEAIGSDGEVIATVSSNKKTKAEMDQKKKKALAVFKSDPAVYAITINGVKVWKRT